MSYIHGPIATNMATDQSLNQRIHKANRITKRTAARKAPVKKATKASEYSAPPSQ